MRYCVPPRYMARAPSGLPGPPATQRGRYWSKIVVIGRYGSTMASGALDATTGQRPIIAVSMTKAELMKFLQSTTRLRPPRRASHYKHTDMQRFHAGR